MLRYKMVKNTKKHVKYKYYPECGEQYGTVVCDKENNVFSEIILAENDWFKRYMGHMVKAIRVFNENGEYMEKGKIIWY